jgi:hypothetical protein
MYYYTISSGTATNIIGLCNNLDVYLVNLGWSRHYTVASGADLVDRVYHNNGGQNGVYGDIYARWQGDSTSPYRLKQMGYSFYANNGSSYSGEMSNDSLNNNGMSVDGCKYWFIGDKDVVWIVLKHTVSGTYFSSSIGYVESYYPVCKDYYPLCIVGGSTSTETFESDRTMMYNGISGTQFYTSIDQSDLLSYGAPQSRDGSYFSMPIPLFNKNIDYFEARGQLKAIGQVYGTGIRGDKKLTVSGTTTTFLTINHGDQTNTYVYGPFKE